MALQHADIATVYREIYRAEFREDVLASNKKPFLLPLHFLGLWVLPTLYLAIPHKNRPWLYHARWLVLAFVVVFNFDIILNVSSHNFVSAYGAGLIAAWGIIWNFTLLVWTKPQWDAKRVDIRKKDQSVKPEKHGDGELDASSLSTSIENNQTARITGSNTSEGSGNLPRKGNREELDYAETSGTEPNGPPTMNGSSSSQDLKERRARVDAAKPQDENGTIAITETDLEKLAANQEIEYYWQEYPADASFWTRLDWAFDIVSTFRMTGWNWAIPCLPPYRPPPSIGTIQLPLSAVGPQRSKQGYTRELSYTRFFLTRVFFNMVPSYIVVDFCAVFMTADPYFVLGPEHKEPLPPHLASLSPLQLSAQRTALSFFAVVSALQLALTAGALALAFLPPLPQILGFRAHPWHLPSATGSFTQVLDRGLAGFWGAWWHQTFRFGFAAPTRRLQRSGHAPPGTAFVFAFLQSGFLHASASRSTVPRLARWYLPPLFFLCAGLGAGIQARLASALARVHGAPALPRWVRRLGNLAFVLAWMWLTSWLLVDDFGRCGLWLFEPVPVSLFRALGYGPTLDRRVWRYDWEMLPRWHCGGRWWECGIAV
ncbi:hypothetical protein GGR54DRAFT_628291 [Hypoxylon sp. NC1633]|nr:hypothetical protein GGR54DRAFT_628291 [Hypoxylon sp. NC1633]